MALTLATNIASINTQKWLGVSGAGQSTNLERLSSGSKINKAADDAAGSAISTKLNVKAASINKAIDNGNQAIAMLQTAESGMTTISDILTRLKELATEAASDNNSTDRASLQAERVQLELQIDNIASGTKYGATTLLGGKSTMTNVGSGLTPDAGIANIDVSNAKAATYTLSFTAATDTWTLDDGLGTSQDVVLAAPTGLDQAQVNFSALGVSVTVNAAATADIAANNTFDVTKGAGSFSYQLGDTSNSYNLVTASIGKMDLDSLKLSVTITATLVSWSAGSDAVNLAGAQAYLDKLNEAGAGIDYVNTQRAGIGASQNQINYQISNLENTLQNTQAASSTIKDTDYAKSMSEFTKFQVMTQAGVAMLAQSNQLPQQILSLLKG